MEVLNRLPAEIWEIIFMDLDKSSLLAATLTCKDFYNFIYGSSEVMNNYRLVVYSFKQQKEFISYFGSNFRAFRLRYDCPVHYSISKPQKLLDVLQNVVELTVHSLLVNFHKYPDFKIDLPCLKFLKMESTACTSKVSYLFRDIKLEKIKIDISNFFANAFDDDFVAWVHGQDRLKTLDLDFNSFFIFFTRIDVSKITFKLKTLKVFIQNYVSQKIHYEENFSEFMKNQDEIEEIHVEVFSENWPRSFNRAFKHIIAAKNLKTLKLDLDTGVILKVPDININNTLQNFRNSSTKQFGLVQFFPHLKKYEDNSVDDLAPVLESLSINCPDLEVLNMKMNTISWSLYVDKMNLINLKEIHFLNCFRSNGFWNKIVEGAPAIEKLILHHFSLDCGTVQYMVSKWHNFKELHLGRGSYNLDTFDSLESSDSFKKLIISKTTFQQIDFENVNYRIYVYENGLERWNHWTIGSNITSSTIFFQDYNNGNDFNGSMLQHFNAASYNT